MPPTTKTKKVTIVGAATPTQEQNANAYTDDQIAQLRLEMGPLANLSTSNITSIVNALNEVNAKIPVASANAYITNFYQSVL